MIIKLYHGSNVTIHEIDLSKSLVDKDFGKGFYLTDIESQAEGMAQRRVRIMGSDSPIVTAFEFNDVPRPKDITMLRFCADCCTISQYALIPDTLDLPASFNLRCIKSIEILLGA